MFSFQIGESWVCCTCGDSPRQLGTSVLTTVLKTQITPITTRRLDHARLHITFHCVLTFRMTSDQTATRLKLPLIILNSEPWSEFCALEGSQRSNGALGGIQTLQFSSAVSTHTCSKMSDQRTEWSEISTWSQIRLQSFFAKKEYEIII